MLVSVKRLPECTQFLAQVQEIERAMLEMPEVIVGDDSVELKHSFGDGLYIREMKAPKGMFNVSKLHKTTHPYFIMEGEFSVLTEAGVNRIKAPHMDITKAGTKRVVLFHEDTTWITVHATNSTDLQEIEDEVIAKTYDELPVEVKKRLSEEEAEVQACLL